MSDLFGGFLQARVLSVSVSFFAILCRTRCCIHVCFSLPTALHLSVDEVESGLFRDHPTFTIYNDVRFMLGEMARFVHYEVIRNLQEDAPSKKAVIVLRRHNIYTAAVVAYL